MTTLPETVPVFYDDFYRREMEVWVDAVVDHEKHGPCLVLSETLCHPHGGGQKGDRAELALTEEEAATLGVTAQVGVTPRLAIVDTRREGGSILHIIEGTVLEGTLDSDAAEEVLVGSRPFPLQLNWEFRHTQMRLHSAAHLLHCFIERELGGALDFPETSDIQPDFGLNRYDRKELLDERQFRAALEKLNAFTAAGHGIDTWPDEEREGFRYWKCGGWVIPCGGTHPADTREIGAVEGSLSLKRGRTGMTFRLGG
jgi:alanyl-tRNA synthetase/misacylated tRNA(Ala) deacylase